MTRQTAQLATRSVRYLEVGAGRPLVLLHAFPLNAEQWLPQLAHVPAGWRAVAFDARGFGSTPIGPAAAAPSMDTLAADALELMAHLDMPRAVVCGLSMGGYVALAMVRRAAARVQGLVLADTRAGADSPEGRAGRDQMLALVAREGSAGVARQMLPKMIGQTATASQPDLVEAVRQQIESAPADAIAFALRAMRDRPDSRDLLPSIACPTLVVVGDEDQLTPPSEAHALVEAIPGAGIQTLSGAGHLSNLEQPAAFNLALARWLAALPVTT